MGVFKEDACPSFSGKQLNDGLRTWVRTRLFLRGAGLFKALRAPQGGLAKKPYETGVAVPNFHLEKQRPEGCLD